MSLPEFKEKFTGIEGTKQVTESAPNIERLPPAEEMGMLNELGSVYPEGFMGYTGLSKFGIENLSVFEISGVKHRILLAVRRNNSPSVSIDSDSWSERSVKVRVKAEGKIPYYLFIMFPNDDDKIDSFNGNVRPYCLDVTYAGEDGFTVKPIFTVDQKGKRITRNIQGGIIDRVMILTGVKGNTIEGAYESGGYVVLQP
jgi:hypothetical protein